MTLGTDYYSECENGLIALVKSKLPTVFPNEWSIANDDTIIARGGDNFLVLRPGKFPYNRGSEMEEGLYDWQILGDLYIRYVAYKTSWDRFKAVRSDLINLVHMYPNLNNTAGVLNVSLASNERPGYFKLDETTAKASFIFQSLEFTVRQWVTFAGGEI